MNDSSYKIEPADIDDYVKLESLFKIANKYSIERSGEPLWTNMEVARNDLRNHVYSGESYIIRDGNRIAATMTISNSDKLWDDNNDSLYLHKLMKNSDIKIPNVGKIFLQFAVDLALSQNRKYLRCDTITTLSRLINYYKRIGFEERGHFIYSSSDRQGVLLEAKVDDVFQALK